MACWQLLARTDEACAGSHRCFREIFEAHGPQARPLKPVQGVLDLIAENFEASVGILKARQRMHMLQGYAAVYECHVGNAEDLLLAWHAEGGVAYILRLGSHDQVPGRLGRC